jgi:Cu2+-exporting ATPase
MRFWISIALTLPILGLSPMLQSLVGLRDAVRFSGDLYVLSAFHRRSSGTACGPS